MRFTVDDKHLIKWMWVKKNYVEQELCYRKQIARKLRTQYAEGIYENPVRDLEI